LISSGKSQESNEMKDGSEEKEGRKNERMAETQTKQTATDENDKDLTV